MFDREKKEVFLNDGVGKNSSEFHNDFWAMREVFLLLLLCFNSETSSELDEAERAISALDKTHWVIFGVFYSSRAALKKPTGQWILKLLHSEEFALNQLV